MTGSTKHDLFRGSSAGGSCGVVMVVVPAFVFILPVLSFNIAWHGVSLLTVRRSGLSCRFLYLYNISVCGSAVGCENNNTNTQQQHMHLALISLVHSLRPILRPIYRTFFCFYSLSF